MRPQHCFSSAPLQKTLPKILLVTHVEFINVTLFVATTRNSNKSNIYKPPLLNKTMTNIRRLVEKSLGGEGLKLLNLRTNPFYTTVKHDVQELAGRDQEIEELARATKDLMDGKCEHIAILGSHGAGKTHLLRVWYNFLSMDEALAQKLRIQAKKAFYIEGLGEFVTTLLPMLELPSHTIDLKTSNERKPVAFIDDMDVIALRYYEQLPLVFSKFKIIGTWNSDYWEDRKITKGYRIPNPEIITLRPLTEKNALEMLKSRLNETSIDGKSIFSEDVLRELIRAVRPNNPYRLLDYSYKYLNFLLLQKETPTIDNLRKFLEGAGFIPYKIVIDYLKNLKTWEKEVLDLILRNYSEITATELSKMTGITRVGARRRLEQLANKKLVTKRTKRNVTVYFVSEEIESLYAEVTGENDEELTLLDEVNKNS